MIKKYLGVAVCVWLMPSLAQVPQVFGVFNNASIEQPLFTANNNPSHWIKTKNAIGIYNQNRLGIAGILSAGLAAQKQIKNSQLSFGFYQNGTDYVNQRTAKLGYGIKVNELLTIGVSAAWAGMYQTQNYGNLNLLQGGIYASTAVIKQFSASMYLNNSVVAGSPELLQDAGCAVAYSPNSSIKIGLAAKVNQTEKGILGLWLNYQHPSHLNFNLSANSSSEPVVAAIGFTFKHWQPMLVYKQNNKLGSTIGMGIQWQN